MGPGGGVATLTRPSLRYRWAKRLVDLVVAGVALVVVSPVLAVCAVAIKATSAGPVLFRQERVGLHGRPFTLLKLRTMTHGNDDRIHREYVTSLLAGAGPESDGAYKLVGDPRITRVGRHLRAWSLDELPQLVNVVRGEMSLVGPRPILPYEHDLLDGRQRRRDHVLPGITGLWQVSGRNRLSWAEMLELDLRFASTTSLSQDLSILWRTPATLLRGDGAR